MAWRRRGNCLDLQSGGSSGVQPHALPPGIVFSAGRGVLSAESEQPRPDGVVTVNVRLRST